MGLIFDSCWLNYELKKSELCHLVTLTLLQTHMLCFYDALLSFFFSWCLMAYGHNLVSLYGNEQLRHSPKHLLLCYKEVRLEQCRFFCHVLFLLLWLCRFLLVSLFFSPCPSLSLPFPISLVLPALVPFIKAEMALWVTYPHHTERLSLHAPQETAFDCFTDITSIILCFRSHICRCKFCFSPGDGDAFIKN